MSNTRPLWEVMHESHVKITKATGPIASRRMFAAELRAIAKTVQIQFNKYFRDGDPVLLEVIDWLDAEADRAEAGE